MPIIMIHSMEVVQTGVLPYTLDLTVLGLADITDGTITIATIDGIPGIIGMIHGTVTIDGMIHGVIHGAMVTTDGIHLGVTIDGTMVGTIDGMDTTTALPAMEEIISTLIIMTVTEKLTGDHDARDQPQHLHAGQ